MADSAVSSRGDGGSGFRVQSIFYVALLLLALLAIFSYSPTDGASISGGIDAPPSNWIGSAGAYFAFWLFNLFGLATYVLVFVTLLRLLRAVLPGRGRPGLFFAGEAMILVGAVLLLALSPYPFVSLTDRLGIGRSGIPELALTGGVIGQVLAAPAVGGEEDGILLASDDAWAVDDVLLSVLVHDKLGCHRGTSGTGRSAGCCIVVAGR